MFDLMMTFGRFNVWFC